MTATDPDRRRTIRRYAHEIYPHAALDEIRPLAAEVPYLYARAIGLEVVGTGWVDEDPAAGAASCLRRENRAMRSSCGWRRRWSFRQWSQWGER